MIRILLIHEFRGLGAIEKTTLALLAGLDRREFEPVIACSDRNGSEFLDRVKDEKVRVHRVRLRFRKGSWALSKALGNAFSGIVLFFQLLRLIRKYSISMIQVHSLQGCLAAIPASFVSKKPLAWVVQEYFPLRRCPKIFFRLLARFVFRFLPVSRYVARHIQILGIPRRKIEQIRIGIPEELTDRETAAGFSREVHSVGVLIRRGNRQVMDSFVQAVKLILMEFENIRFFVSSGGQKDSLKTLEEIAKVFPSRPELFDPSPDLAQRLSEINLLVHVGNKESFPMEILEAMSAGIACIASRSGANPELILDKRSGILVPPQDGRALAKAIMELLSDAPLREQMAREGRKRALQFFRPEGDKNSLVSVYRQCVLSVIARTAESRTKQSRRNSQ